MESFQFQFPSWYLIFCIAAGLIFAGVLYFRDNTFRDKPPYLKGIMAFLRFLSVSIIASLLLMPFIRLFEESTQEPIIVIAQDNSSSVGSYLTGEDSMAYVRNLTNLSNQLGEDHKVESYLFGDDIRPGLLDSFYDNTTDINKVLEFISEQYDGQNLGAVILATDGIFNKGKDPLYSSVRLGVPVNTIALGDTTIKTDVTIQKVLHNRISFLGDKFPVQVDISAQRLTGRSATLTIQHLTGGASKALVTEEINITRENFFETREFILPADVAGVNRYRVRISGIGGEANYSNNSKDFYIEIIDGRLKILVLGSAPHPDLAALRDAISNNDNYEVEVELSSDFTGNVANYDLVILHQIPDNRNSSAPLLSALENAEIPRIFILGESSSLQAFNSAQDLISIEGGGQSSNEVTPIVNQQFQLFEIDENYERDLNRFVPLNAPFGEYTIGPATEVYLYQRIGNVDTRYPLVSFGKAGNTKIAVVSGEGIWRWRLFDYAQNTTHDLTNSLINKVVQYTTVKDDRRRFRASPIKNLYSTDESISFGAELYNQTYQLVNTPEAFLVVRDSENKEYSYTFSKTQSSYSLDIGRFAEGEYTYTAFVDYEGQRLQASGKFSVQEIMLESYITTADHSLLYALTDKYGGAVYYPNNLTDLEAQLTSSDLKPVIYQSARNSPLLNMQWLFAILLILLGTEWFLRRYYGAY